MVLGQKEAVIQYFMAAFPTFVQFKDNALAVLNATQLEDLKGAVAAGILAGTIKYGKDLNNTAEVNTYARSMVMNHLKKAPELNGGVAKSATPAKEKPAKQDKSGINKDILPDELKAVVEMCEST